MQTSAAALVAQLAEIRLARVLQLPSLPHDLARLLRSTDLALAEICLSLVATMIAGGSDPTRETMLSHGVGGAVAFLLSACQPTAFLRRALSVARHLCSRKPDLPLEHAMPFVPKLVPLTSHDDQQVAAGALCCLSDLTELRGELLGALLGSANDNNGSALPTIFAALHSGWDALLVPALRIASHFFCAGTSAHVRAAIAHGVMQAMPTLLRHAKRAVRKDAAWALSNVLLEEDGAEYVDLMLNCDVLPHLLGNLVTPELDVRREATHCINNARDRRRDGAVVAQPMIEAGVIPLLCGNLH